MGNAVIKACEQIRRQLRVIAARALEVDESAIDCVPGECRTPKGAMSYAEAMQAGLGPPRGKIIGVGEERGGGYRPEHPLGGRPEFWEFMCTALEVEGDQQTWMGDV